MALINCPECNHQISDKATKCVNCSFPLNQIKEEPKHNHVNNEKLNHFEKQYNKIHFKETGDKRKFIGLFFNWSINLIKSTKNLAVAYICILLGDRGKSIYKNIIH